MAASVRSASSDENATGNTQTITKPAGTAEGDLLLYFGANDIDEDAVGWDDYTNAWDTVIIDTNGAARMSSVTIKSRIAGASEPADYTFRLGDVGEHTDQNSGLIVCITGQDATWQDSLTAFAERLNDATPASVNFTPTQDDCLVLQVIFAVQANALTDTSQPSGYTGQVTTAIPGSVADQPVISVAYLAQTTATATGTADWWASNTSATVDAQVIGIAIASGASGDTAPAEVASATLTASGATAKVAPTAGAAQATLAATDAQARVAPAATEAQAAFSAHDATTAVAPAATEAQAAFSAHDAQASVAPLAGAAQATLSAHDATVSTAVETRADAEAAQAALAAHDAQASVAPASGTAQAAFSAHDATATGSTPGSADAEAAQAAFSAHDATTAVAPAAGTAQAAFSAHDATVSTATVTQAPATEAQAALAAHGATVQVSPSAGAAQAALTAHQAQARVAPAAGTAQAALSAHDATVAIEHRAQAEVATIAWTAHGATAATARLALAETAYVTWTAHQAASFIVAPGVAYAQTAYARWSAYRGGYRPTPRGSLPVLLEPQTLTVITPAADGPSAYGNRTYDYVNGTRREIIGWLQQDARSEGSDPGREAKDERWLLVTDDASVGARDRIEWLGHPLGPIVLEVEGPPEPAWRPGGYHHTEATLRKVAG